MGKETAVKNSKPLEPRRYLKELNKLSKVKKYNTLFIIDDLLAKIKDDNEAVIFIEHLIDFLGKDPKYGIPYFFKDNDVRNKCYEYVLRPERYWRKMKMLSTEAGRKHLKKARLIYLTKADVPEDYKTNEVTIVPDLRTPFVDFSKENVIKSTLTWKKNQLIWLRYFIHCAGVKRLV